MPKKKVKNKRPMRSIPERFPKVAIAMSLGQVYGHDGNARKHEELTNEIYTTIFDSGMPSDEAREDVEAMCNNVHPDDKMNATLATTAIFTALKR